MKSERELCGSAQFGRGPFGKGTIWKETILMTRLSEKVPFINQTIWLPDRLLCRLIERDGLSAGAETGG